MNPTAPVLSRFDALRAAVPAPLDVLAALDGAAPHAASTFPPANAPAPSLRTRHAAAERAACVAAAYPLPPLQAVHPAPFAAAVVAVAYAATERAQDALWAVEHIADALRVLMIDALGTANPARVAKMEALWGVLDGARARAELAVDVAREAVEARPENLPGDALSRMLDAEARAAA